MARRQSPNIGNLQLSRVEPERKRSGGWGVDREPGQSLHGHPSAGPWLPSLPSGSSIKGWKAEAASPSPFLCKPLPCGGRSLLLIAVRLREGSLGVLAALPLAAATSLAAH